MKRKIIAIALSLALLSSLFVFVAPVVAETGKSNENAGFSESTTTFTKPDPWDTSNYTNVLKMEDMQQIDKDIRNGKESATEQERTPKETERPPVETPETEPQSDRSTYPMEKLYYYISGSLGDPVYPVGGLGFDPSTRGVFDPIKALEEAGHPVR